MTVEYVDGVKVMKLHDCGGSSAQADDALAVVKIWQLLTGGHAMRDGSVFCHKL
jgi:hypothetical protein